MMGDRDFRSIIKSAVESIGRELEIKIDGKDLNTIHLKETTQCLRRSYYDRTEPVEIQRRGFNELTSGLLRKLEYGTKSIDYDIENLKLKGESDMIVDDVIILFRSSQDVIDTPFSSDLLYLNACLWMYDKLDGIVVYISGDRKESSFSITRNKKMFEEVIRRARVLHDLLKEKKLPILEPSTECSDCQYYEKCYIIKRMGKQLSIGEMIGLKKSKEDN